jgi:murein DD-endopeptidase MepM/ murein hydrolase activator NlpD
MSNFDEPSRSRTVSRLALLALMSAGVAGCSSDFSRISENPWTSKPQASAQGSAGSSEVTGSVRPAASSHAASSHKVESAALAPPSQPTYGGGTGMASYQPPQQAAAAPAPAPAPRAEITGSVTTPARPPQQPSSSWSWDGGTAVVVAQGETIETISKRHHVPAAAIRQANNMGPTTLLQPGQRLVIPRLANAPQPNSPQLAAPQTRVAGPLPAPAAPAAGNHVVAPGETIYSLARRYHLTPMAIAKANNLTLAQQLRIGQQVVIPGGGNSRIAMPAQPVQPAPVAPAPAPAPQRVAAAPQPVPPVKQATAPKMAQAEPPQSARVVTPAADPAPEPATGSAPPATNSAASFRWPVRGRVIAGFGPKPNGQQNDGINVSVPEGTPIKAAEDGTVAYAGSELKGYGNLVLVRHANGFVTAYAHASELSVKKGDSVKRGQVIGKAGATGNVTSPQLHFEVRRGATPVDPAQYLTGG